MTIPDCTVLYAIRDYTFLLITLDIATSTSEEICHCNASEIYKNDWPTRISAYKVSMGLRVCLIGQVLKTEGGPHCLILTQEF